MTSRRTFHLIATTLLVATAAAVGVAQRTAATLDKPGSLGGGVTLLPNGWRIAPAGRHMAIGDLPLNMVLSPDGHSLIVTNNGYQKPTMRVVDLDRGHVAVVQQDDAWLGLAWHPDGKRLYSSGAASNTVQELSWAAGRLRAGQKIPVGKNPGPMSNGQTRPPTAQQTFVGGIAVSADGARLFAVHVFGKLVTAVDLASGKIEASVSLPAEPYTCLLSADGSTLYVSLWGGASILLLDPKTLGTKGQISVGEHPNAMVQSKDGTRLFVACANTNAVWVLDLAGGKPTEQISIALYPQSPP